MKAQIRPTAVSGGSALSVVIATGGTPTSNRWRELTLLSRSLYAASNLEGGV
jgi:hypothetical protein